MRFLAIYKPDEKNAGVPPTREHTEEMGKFMEDSFKSGVLLATGGLLPMAQGGIRMRRSNGQISLIDGPFTESKEFIAGFALLQVGSRDDALRLCREFLTLAGDGESEVHQVMDEPPATETVRTSSIDTEQSAARI